MFSIPRNITQFLTSLMLFQPKTEKKRNMAGN